MRLGLQIELFRDNKIKQPFVQSQTNQELSMLEFREPLYQKVTQWKLYSVSPLSNQWRPYLTESNANT